MARGKKRARKMPAWRKWTRAGFGIFGKVIGGLVIASPALAEVGRLQSGDVAGYAKWTLFRYTGFDSDQGKITNPGQTVAGIGSVIGGIVILKLFSWAAKRF